VALTDVLKVNLTEKESQIETSAAQAQAALVEKGVVIEGLREASRLAADAAAQNVVECGDALEALQQEKDRAVAALVARLEAEGAKSAKAAEQVHY
jgi:LysM repeat protein